MLRYVPLCSFASTLCEHVCVCVVVIAMVLSHVQFGAHPYTVWSDLFPNYGSI